MPKKLYTGFSFFQFIWLLFLRLAVVTGMVYALVHYEENPALIIVVAVVCVIFILILGDDQVIVYEDRVVQTTNSFAALFFRKNDKTIFINDVKLAYLENKPASSAAEIGVAVALNFLLPKQSANRDNAKPIFFDLKDNTTVQIDTHLETGKMKCIAELVNALVKEEKHPTNSKFRVV